MATPASASPPATARPGRLGPAYAKLWTAAAVSYVGDGIHDTALPLLAASLTRDPLLVATIPGRFAATPPGTAAAARSASSGGGLRAQIREGVRWLARHRLLRTLAVMAAIQQLGLAAWSSILVLFAQDRLGLGNLGFGLLWTGVAAGSLLGSLLAARLSRAVGTATVLLASAITLGVATLGIGVSTNPWTAGSLLGTIGIALTVWNVVAISLRQAIVPDRLIGRVNSVFQQLSMGMLPVGAALGGLLGHTLGLRAPFLITGVMLLAAAVLAMPAVTSHAIDAARTHLS